MIMSGQNEGNGSLPRRNSIVEFMRSIMEDAESDGDVNGDDNNRSIEGAAEVAAEAAAAEAAAEAEAEAAVPASVGDMDLSPVQQRKRTRTPVGQDSSDHIDASLFADVSPEELNQWLVEADVERKPAASSSTPSYSERVADIRRATSQLGGVSFTQERSFVVPPSTLAKDERFAQHERFASTSESAGAHSMSGPRRSTSLDLSHRSSQAAAAMPTNSTEAELQNLPEERQYQFAMQQSLHASLPRAKESRDAKRSRMLLGRKAESERAIGSRPMVEKQSDYMTQGHYSAGAIMQVPMHPAQHHFGNLAPIPQSPVVMTSPMIIQFGQQRYQSFSQEMMQAVPPPPFPVGGFEQIAGGAPAFASSAVPQSQRPVVPQNLIPYPMNPVAQPSSWGKPERPDTATVAPPAVPAACLSNSMRASQESQQSIHDWDRSMGLRRSHSKTMRASSRSRKKLLEMQAMQDMSGMDLVLNEHRAKMA